MNVGPRVLKGRAFPVQWLVLVYNLAMVGLNFWMAKEMVVTTWSEYAWLRELIYPGLINTIDVTGGITFTLTSLINRDGHHSNAGAIQWTTATMRMH